MIKRIGEMIMLKPGCGDEYEKYHAEPWPEVNAMISECNICNYSIFRRGDFLFAYYEYTGEDFEADMAKMAADPKTQEWWSVVKPLMEPLFDREPGEWWSAMRSVYYLT